jgi:predicted transcriptional regulator
MALPSQKQVAKNYKDYIEAAYIYKNEEPFVDDMPVELLRIHSDTTVAYMFDHLLRKFEKAPENAWLPYSAEDWEKALGLSNGVVRRIYQNKVLENFGIVREVKKAVDNDKYNGRPVSHFRLNVRKFIHKIAAAMDISFDEMKKIIRSVEYKIKKETPQLPTLGKTRQSDLHKNTLRTRWHKK